MSPKSTNLARITICDHYATVRGATHLGTAILSAPIRRFEDGQPNASPQLVQGTECFVRERAGRLLTSPGLVPLLIGELTARSIPVEVTDRRTLPPSLMIPPSVVASAFREDRPLLEALARDSRGQIEVGGTVELIRAIRLLARALPACRILVLSATIRRARQIWRRLRGEFPGEMWLARGSWQTQRRIVCSTYCYARDANEWGVVLFSDVSDLANDSAGWKAASVLRGHPRRIYAFARRGWRPTPREAMVAQYFAGPVIHSTQPDAARVNLQVCRAAEFQLPHAQTGLERKRRIWHHDSRNNLIARIATAFARQEIRALGELGLMLGAADVNWMAEVADRIRVAVLVESSEHGKELQRRLEDWPLLALSPTTSPAAASVGQRLRGLGTIVTQTHASQHGISADVIVRADGGDKLVIPGFPPAAAGVSGGSVVIVELEDGPAGPPQPEHRRQDVRARRRQAGRAAAGKGVKKKARSSTKQPRLGRSRQSDHGHPGEAGQQLPYHPTLAGNPAPPHPEAATAPDHSSPGDLPERRVLTPPSTTGRYPVTGVHVRPTRIGTDRRGRARGTETPDGSADQAAISGEQAR